MFLSVFDVFNPGRVPCSRNTLQDRKFSSITHSNAMRRQVSDVEGKGRNLRQFHIGFLGFSRHLPVCRQYIPSIHDKPSSNRNKRSMCAHTVVALSWRMSGEVRLDCAKNVGHHNKRKLSIVFAHIPFKQPCSYSNPQYSSRFGTSARPEETRPGIIIHA